MNLDIRFPIGIIFSLLGAILAAFGLISRSDEAIYKASLGININFWWGLVLLVFGLLMLWLARRANRVT